MIQAGHYLWCDTANEYRKAAKELKLFCKQLKKCGIDYLYVNSIIRKIKTVLTQFESKHKELLTINYKKFHEQLLVFEKFLLRTIENQMSTVNKPIFERLLSVVLFTCFTIRRFESYHIHHNDDLDRWFLNIEHIVMLHKINEINGAIGTVESTKSLLDHYANSIVLYQLFICKFQNSTVETISFIRNEIARLNLCVQKLKDGPTDSIRTFPESKIKPSENTKRYIAISFADAYQQYKKKLEEDNSGRRRKKRKLSSDSNLNPAVLLPLKSEGQYGMFSLFSKQESEQPIANNYNVTVLSKTKR